MIFKLKRSAMLRRCCLILLGIGICLQTACDRQKPQTYKIPKESPPAQIAGNPNSNTMQALPGMEAFTNQTGNISYIVPDSWTEFPASSVRKANFNIENADGSAEVSITVFPGTVGGYLANINRWRRQIGLEPIDEAKLNTNLIPFTISKHQGYYSFLEGNTQSILGAQLKFHGVTWFVKMQGALLTVQSEKDNFLSFLSSLEIEDTHH